MAMLKVCNGKEKYYDIGARETVARYICNPLKAESGLIGAVGITEDIVDSMNEVAIRFGKINGVQLRHLVLSFLPDELDCPEDVFEIACPIAQFIGQDYQVVFAVHENTANLHIHFMFNSISYRDGHRYYGKKKEYYALVNFIKAHLKQLYRFKLITVSNLSGKDIQ